MCSLQKWRLKTERLSPWISAAGIGVSTVGLLSLSLCIATPWQHLHLSSIFLLLGILSTGFLFYFLSATRLFQNKPWQIGATGVLVFAALFRLVAAQAQPLFDDDIFRYMWDGKVTAAGENPYSYSPEEVVLPPFEQLARPHTDIAAEREIATLDRLNDLWFEHPSEIALFNEINYPDVKTIYPPTSQAFFAVAYRVSPSPDLVMPTFKILFAALDWLTVLCLVLLLKTLGRPPQLALLYGWNPMVIKELAGTGHMDALPIFLSVFAVLLFVQKKHLWAFLVLALGITAKLYPVLLLPFFVQRLWSPSPRKTLLGLGLTGATVGILYTPFLGAGPNMFSGTTAYATIWEMNAGIYAILKWAFGLLAPQGAVFSAKLLCGALLIGVLGYTLKRKNVDTDDWVTGIGLVLGAAFLLSPVQNPWYLCWALPFLVLKQPMPWLVLSATVLLYYIYFTVAMTYPPSSGWRSILLPGLVALQYVPFILLLLRGPAGKLLHRQR